MKTESVFKEGFAEAVDEFLSSINKPKQPRIATGITALDELVGGGFQQGSVIVLLGPSGVGKSALLRNVAVAASKHEHVLYVPLQDGGMKSAVRRILALEAGMESSAFDKEADPHVRLAAIDAGDRLKDQHDLSVFVEDGFMVSPMLCEAVAEDFSGSSDAVQDLDGYEGLVIVDSLSMLADGQEIRSAIRAMKSIVYGSQIVLITAAAGSQSGINDFADADMVVLAEAGKSTGQHLNMELTVLRDSTGMVVGGTAKASFNRETMAIEQ